TYASAILRRQRLDRRSESRMARGIDRAVAHLAARGILPEIIVAVPVARRTDGPRRKVAAAIRADVVQHVGDACGAERAFVRADARLQRGGRQRLVAVLAGGSQLEHRAFSADLRRRTCIAVAALVGIAQSTLRPTFLITGPHLSISP